MNDLSDGDFLPLLPLRNSVLFPAAVVPVNVGRKRSVRLIEQVEANERALIVAVAQRSHETEDPDFDDLYEVATVARILKIIRLGSKSYSVVLQGMSRCRTIRTFPIFRTSSISETVRAQRTIHRGAAAGSS